MFWLFCGFFLLVLALLALDLGVFHRKAHAISLREAAGWTVFWVTLGVSFSGLIFLIYEHHWFGASCPAEGGESVGGGLAVARYLTAYVIEKSLSIDNIFVMSLLFRSFAVPAEHQHRVLFWGIVGALVFRGAMIAGGVWLVSRFSWSFYIFGGYLAFAGIKLLLSKHDHDEPIDGGQNRLVRLLQRMLPITDQDHGDRFVAREGGRLVFTRLAVALVAIELTDVVFAVDSIPAVLAISTESFIVVTSNVFAILGLRSLYFVLASMIGRFRYLTYALAALLVFIGGKMIAHSFFKISTGLSLAIVVGLVAAGMLASLLPKPPAADSE